MKAAVYMGGPDNIQIQDVPEPSIAEGEALIRIEACNICGVDLRTFNNGDKKITPPRILGHELSGSVVELKSNSVDLKVGDRVTMYVVIPCGVCSFCRKGRTNLCDNRTTMGYDHDGGFAEYMLVPRPALENKQLIRLPGHISFEAAALAEPLGTVINSHGHLNIGIKDTVVIIGAGPIGLLHSLLSKIEGANHVCVMDVSRERLKLAEAFNLDSYVQVTEDREHIKIAKGLNDGLGPDVVIAACSVAEAQVDALEMAGKGARIEFFGGLPKSDPYANLNTNLIHYRELVVSGSFSQKLDDLMNALKLISNGKFPAEHVISHRFGLNELPDAFALIQSGQAIKVSIKPNE